MTAFEQFITTIKTEWKGLKRIYLKGTRPFKCDKTTRENAETLLHQLQQAAKRADPFPSMPAKWDDQKGWEHYYSSVKTQNRVEELKSMSDMSMLEPQRLASTIHDLREQKVQTIWFPGCGVSALPKIFSHFGFVVHATDISCTAIHFQQSDDNDIDDVIKPIEEHFHPLTSYSDWRRSGGVLECMVHDFCEPYHQDYFDFIFNIKSFQGFSRTTKEKIARTHFDALKLGRHAWFFTMNVQGERRDELEGCLVEAGFFIPLFEVNAWYRKELQKIGVPHLFILGRPMIPGSVSGWTRWRGERAIRRIMKEYEMKAQTVWEEEQHIDLSKQKTASVIYSAG